MKVTEKRLFPHLSDEKWWEFFLSCDDDVLYLFLFAYGNLLYLENDMLKEGNEDKQFDFVSNKKHFFSNTRHILNLFADDDDKDYSDNTTTTTNKNIHS